MPDTAYVRQPASDVGVTQPSNLWWPAGTRQPTAAGTPRVRARAFKVEPAGRWTSPLTRRNSPRTMASYPHGRVGAHRLYVPITNGGHKRVPALKGADSEHKLALRGSAGVAVVLEEVCDNPTVEVEIVAETLPTNDIRSVRARRGVS